ncbi:hypothetical protein CBM2599_B120125 [Cupriavidus taiwanensis]|nr:hypothetical protein CBM2599_B120125 [Cupriavidus taiwanensis]SOY98325.1 hypothetical protein CBM2600_B130126 [Cupriavidus taiwanensis]SPA30839.1 hypothetical protein CBM2637_B110016 [Cupriavidus taiwanensis]
MRTWSSRWSWKPCSAPSRGCAGLTERHGIGPNPTFANPEPARAAAATH